MLFYNTDFITFFNDCSDGVPDAASRINYPYGCIDEHSGRLEMFIVWLSSAESHTVNWRMGTIIS